MHLVLRPSDEDASAYQIALHEDFYHPDDVVALVAPPLIPLVRWLHTFGTIASIVNARLAGLLGMSCPSLIVHRSLDVRAPRVLVDQEGRQGQRR